jgi:hypothetical protein
MADADALHSRRCRLCCAQLGITFHRSGTLSLCESSIPDTISAMKWPADRDRRLDLDSLAREPQDRDLVWSSASFENQNPVAVASTIVSRRRKLARVHVLKWRASHQDVGTVSRIVPLSDSRPRRFRHVDRDGAVSRQVDDERAVGSSSGGTICVGCDRSKVSELFETGKEFPDKDGAPQEGSNRRSPPTGLPPCR